MKFENIAENLTYGYSIFHKITSKHTEEECIGWQKGIREFAERRAGADTDTDDAAAPAEAGPVSSAAACSPPSLASGGAAQAIKPPAATNATRMAATSPIVFFFDIILSPYASRSSITMNPE